MSSNSPLDEVRRRDLNLLFVFRVLLETSSVSKAAEVLDVSQSAVSKALERLRIEFQDPLLVRTSNKMFLTERAKRLAPLVNSAFDRIEQVFEHGHTFNPQETARTLTIGANEYMQQTLGQELVACLKKETPSNRVNFRPISSNVPALLAEGSLDMVIGTDTHESRGLRSRVVYEDELVCVAGNENRNLYGLSLSDFVSHPQVDISPSGLGTLPRMIEQQLLKNGETRNVVAMMSSYFVLPDLLSKIGAISLIPRRMLSGSLLGTMLREIPLTFPAPNFEIRLYWHNVSNGDPFSAWLRDLIVEIADKRTDPKASRRQT